MASEGSVDCMRNCIPGKKYCMLTTHTSPDIKQYPQTPLAADLEEQQALSSELPFELAL
jgi:hypothetical protein